MHMAWVGLTRLHLHLNPRSPARDPSQRRTQWGCVCGGVGVRKGGCTGLGGQRHSHTDRLRDRERAVRVTLLFLFFLLSICVYSCVTAIVVPINKKNPTSSVCVCVCVLCGATLCKPSDSRWSCDHHDSL